MKKLKPFGELSSPNSLRLTVGDLNPDIARALATEFTGAPDVQMLAPYAARRPNRSS